jgi:hypothetical protein
MKLLEDSKIFCFLLKYLGMDIKIKEYEPLKIRYEFVDVELNIVKDLQQGRFCLNW